MKTMKSLRLAVVSLFLLALSLPAFAGGITNSFNDGVNNIYPLDLLPPLGPTNGVLSSFFDDGKTMWDGVWIVAGARPGSPATGTAATINANNYVTSTFLTTAGYLNIDTVNGTWDGATDAAFYLFKVVNGDFDVSVDVAAPFNNTANNFPGLLVRAFNTGGSPGYNATNRTENGIGLWRFNEFSLDGQISDFTNGTRNQYSFAAIGVAGTNNNNNTNNDRYFRIQRVGTNFFCYLKTNAADAWTGLSNLATQGNWNNATNAVQRPDLIGQPMMVGLVQPTFTANQAETFFHDFELTNQDIGVQVPVACPTGLTIAGASTNSMVFTWTVPTTGPNLPDGSILVVRRDNDPTDSQPANDFAYIGNTNYNYGTNSGTNVSWLNNSSNWVAFVGGTNGSGTESVSINGFGNTNHTYFARVYLYRNTNTVAGPGPSYSICSSANSLQGTGTNLSASSSFTPASPPIGGVAAATVILTYSTGDTLNVSTDPTAVWSSSDTTVLFATNGVVTGVGPGTANAILTYGAISVTNSITTHAPAFTDNFGVNQDYVANGIVGSRWDGVYKGGNDHGATVTLANPAHNTVSATANITTNNQLVVTETGGGWAGNTDDGFLLFKTVTNDFQATAHIAWITATGGNEMSGVMGRATSSTTGARLSTGENWMMNQMYDQFNIPVFERNAANGTDNQVANVQFAPTYTTTNHYWLGIQRINGTNYNFYQRVTNNSGQLGGYVLNPYVPTVLNTAMTNGLRTEVGLATSTFGNGPCTVAFDSFMLDSTSVNLTNLGTPPTGTNLVTMSFFTNAGVLTMTVNWQAVAGATGYLVVMRQSSPVSVNPVNGTAYTANTTFGSGTQIGTGNFVVFNGNALTVNVVATPGFPYYAAVYPYNATGANPSFGTTNAAEATQILGNLQGVSIVQDTRSTVNGANIPVGGAGFVTIWGNYSGSLVNVTTTQASKYAISIDNSNILLFSTLQGANPNITLSGMSNGIANLTVVLTNTALTATFTNTVPVVVRAPHYAYEFTNTHDYLLNGTVGTAFEGVYNTSAANATPGNANQPGGPPSVTSADENITSNGWLTVTTTANYQWEGAGDDGFFLWKRVPGDFFMAIQINTNYSTAAFHNPGILARFYGPQDLPWGRNTNVIGAPATNFNETWYSMTGGNLAGPYARENLQNAVIQRNIGASAANNAQLLIGMARAGGTNWFFFWRTNNTVPWRTGLPSGASGGMQFSLTNGFNVNTLHPDPVQIGIMDATYSSSGPYLTQYAHFLVDVGSPQIFPYQSGNNLFLQYSALFPLGSVQATTNLTPTGWVDIPSVAGGATSNGMVQVSIPLTNAVNYTYFRLRQ
jgi:hypothetical protein